VAQITFYTKIGCSTAAKQVELLEQAGHSVEVCDLLAHPWSPDELLSYFCELPVAEWFNEKSPRVKSGEVKPTEYDRERALEVMLADPLLIRRPLMEFGGERRCGFTPVAIHAWVGLGAALYGRTAAEDYSSCSQPPSGEQVCP